MTRGGHHAPLIFISDQYVGKTDIMTWFMEHTPNGLELSSNKPIASDDLSSISMKRVISMFYISEILRRTV